MPAKREVVKLYSSGAASTVRQERKIDRAMGESGVLSKGS
jgi:hypothetical protein